MKTELIKLIVMLSLLAGLVSAPCLAQRLAPDKAKIEAEAKQIKQMVAANDITGLIDMLSYGEFPSKVTAAEHLGELGDERALPALKQLNKENGGWIIREIHQDRSGAFAVAICDILSRDLPEKEHIDALFELLEGRGPAVPEAIESARMTVNGVLRKIPRRLNNNRDVGERVAAELDKFDDPSIVGRLRRSVNQGASPDAVWMEVRDMATEDAIARCMEIARDEGGAQRYGAIHCLSKFGHDAIDGLDQLAIEGHGEAITVLSYQKEKPEVFKLLCWHLINNKNYPVRLEAVRAVSYIRLKEYRVESLRVLVAALYDPSKNIRRSAARALNNRAYKQNKQYFNEIEDSLLIALKHPDVNVRENIATALTRLGCTRFDEEVPKSPGIRTDLDEFSKPPLTAEQKLRAKTEPLEKEAAKYMEKGPPEKAVTIYKELLELVPRHEPYGKALEKATAYMKAAATTPETWYPDAPYIGIKGRYSYYLVNIPEDMSMLKEEFELAQFLSGEHFESWSNIFGKDLKGKDQFVKALKLYEHIVDYYPENEYLVIRSNAAIGGLKLNLYKDKQSYVLAGIDILATPVEKVVDSTDNRRNKTLEEADGKTRAQLDFERFCKDHMRSRIIELCSGLHRTESYVLLDKIIERCAETDPKIVEMAKAVKAKIDQP